MKKKNLYTDVTSTTYVKYNDELIQFIVWIIPNISLFMTSKLT